jgi:hypothetical protein
LEAIDTEQHDGNLGSKSGHIPPSWRTEPPDLIINGNTGSINIGPINASSGKWVFRVILGGNRPK